MSLWSLGDWEERRRGGFEDLCLLGFAKTFNTLSVPKALWPGFRWKPRCGAPGNPSYSERLHWPVLPPVWTQASLSTHLSVHFAHLVNRFLKTNKMKFPIWDQKKKIIWCTGVHVFPRGQFRAAGSEQQDPGNQTSGDGGGSCSACYLSPRPLPAFSGTPALVSFEVGLCGVVWLVATWGRQRPPGLIVGCRQGSRRKGPVFSPSQKWPLGCWPQNRYHQKCRLYLNMFIFATLLWILQRVNLTNLPRLTY